MIGKYRKLMREKDLDWIVLVQMPNVKEPVVRHLLGMEVGDCSLLIPNRGKVELFASPLVEAHLRLPTYAKLTVCKGVIKELRKRTKGKRVCIGVNMARMPMLYGRALSKIGRLVGVDDELAQLRAVKEPFELRNIRTAIRNTEEILFRCFTGFSSFRTERDVRDFLVDEASVHGLAFDPIVASGRNSRVPHAVPQGTALKKGFCIIDFGVMHRGYRADMTRTAYIGSPSIAHLKVYQKVLMARDAALDVLHAGVNAKIVDKAARDILGDYLAHSLGHGVGIEIHEPPFLRPSSKDVIEKGAVFTLEPAYYGKSFGIRVEDMFLMEERARYLSTPSKSLLILRGRI